MPIHLTRKYPQSVILSDHIALGFPPVAIKALRPAAMSNRPSQLSSNGLDIHRKRGKSISSVKNTSLQGAAVSLQTFNSHENKPGTYAFSSSHPSVCTES